MVKLYNMFYTQNAYHRGYDFVSSAYNYWVEVPANQRYGRSHQMNYSCGNGVVTWTIRAEKNLLLERIK